LPGIQLKDAIGAGATERSPPGFDSRDDFDNAAASIKEDCVDRETHEEHVDGAAGCNPETLVGR
jgi:hypothetical protein